MCGIAGKVYLNKSKGVENHELKLMSQKLAHRGPDDEGIFISDDKRVGLVNRRLAVIDLSSNGHQPMSYKNRYYITYNGEVYNFQSEREKLEKTGYKFKSNSDTEVILALYDKYKLNFLKRLRGMFAFAIYDSKEKTLFLARDRLGKKPLKYFVNSDVFIFASELKSILTQGSVSKEPDWGAINDYLTLGYVPSPKTGFKNIYKLEPGHFIFINLTDKTFIKRQYWKLDFSEKLSLSLQEWKEVILNELDEATRLRMISDVPVGAFLSGGVDSSSVVAMMAKNSSKPIKTFTIIFKEKDLTEEKYARTISKLYRTEHHELLAQAGSVEILPQLAYQYEEPYADSSCVITYMVSKLARQFVTVVLNGDGGDENFAGYDRYARLKRDVLLDPYQPYIRSWAIPFTNLMFNLTKSYFWQRANKFLKKSEIPLHERFATYICYFKNEDKEKVFTPEFKRLNKLKNSYEVLKRKFEESKANDLRDQALYFDVTTYLPEDLLTKVDIASMSVGLEARSPLLDHKIVELAAKIPFDLKVKGYSNFKYVFKEALSDIVPKENLYRSKLGFSIPLSRWFCESLGSYAKAILLAKKSQIKNLINENEIKRMLSSHTKENDFGPKLWSLLALELWLREYFN